MKITVLTLALGLTAGSTFAEDIVINNSGYRASSDVKGVTLNNNNVDRSINVSNGMRQNLMPRLAHVDNFILNEQTNSGDNVATIRGSDTVEAAVEEGIKGDFNGASVSATALSNNLSINVAGQGSTLNQKGSFAGEYAVMNNSARRIALTSLQVNTGDNTARIQTGGDIDAEVDQGAVGSFNTASISATAIGNNVSVNIGGIVK